MFALRTLSLAGGAALTAFVLTVVPRAPAHAAPAAPATLSCPTSTTLEALVDCISNQMPQHDSNGYVAPSATEAADFAQVVTSMLEGNCALSLPASISANMAIRSFTDSSDNRSYCVLMEVKSSVTSGVVDKGWGTFITYNAGTRRISHHAPHPKFDTSTTGASEGDAYSQREAVRIFKKTDSRSFLMAGARRSANLIDSTCQSGNWEADCSHNTNNMFYAANVALNNFYTARSEDWTAIEWHAKAASTCSNDIFMSPGRNTKPAVGSKLALLKAAIETQKPAWVVETTGGTSSCSLTATTNTVGRMLNGVTSNVCNTAATTTSGKFIHIEQTTGLLATLDATATAWANAVVSAFP
ncbi:hypothetical protein [Massilia horti]|uniref:Secreted protein n=1 Tax=Massilia horti TaxID=2562153 RepID=A0A4Y9T0J9_9BURK|nr:hypothetical protein [Massilia horti]TFW30526.1 hypothetical protein E4O92_16565 [Massilia horti]TFW30555.1 hypothetical protein E4O92_16720 [Massilia horti]